jgi:hypothetical protein
MDRRTFLRQSSLMIPGISMAGMLGVTPGKSLAASAFSKSFSLSVVTDQPDKALVMVQELLKQIELPDKNIRYTEYILHGDHVADIAYTRSGQLINFYKDNEPVCTELRKIASRLDMPHSCENPLMAHFSCEAGVQKPTGIRVFKDNQMIIEKSFPNRTETIQLDAPKGKVVLELTKDHSVRFAEASCTHKTCMTMGPISQAGQNLVCIPNRVAVTITGTNLTGVDSVTF